MKKFLSNNCEKPQ